MSTNTDPNWYQNMVASGTVAPGYGAVPPDVITAPGGPYTFGSNTTPNTITLRSGEEEMLRCNTEGFWVRGKKVKQDDKEAEIVYNAFKEWLTWASLNDIR